MNKKHIKILIARAEAEIYEAEIKLTNYYVQEWLYQKEIDNPVTMGKKKAEELFKQAQADRKEWEKRIKNLKVHIESYKDYIQEKNL